MSYGLSPDFERKVAYLSATSRSFWLRIGCQIKPDEIVDPEYAYLFKVLRVIAKDHGYPSEDLVLQRLTYLYNEGKFKVAVFDKLIDVFTAPPVIEDPEKIVHELIPAVRNNLKQELANEVVNNYISDTGKKYGELIARMELVDKLGAPLVDSEMKSTELGEDSFGIMEHVGTGTMMPLGVPELDHALHGGSPLGSLTTFLADSGGGKCHAKGQGILMADGSIRKVEYIVVGDQVMGPDGKPRNVLRTNTGRGMMFNIVPKRGPIWRVNEDHILTLSDMGSYSHGARTNRYDHGWIDVSVKEYLSWPRSKRLRYKLIRSSVLDFGKSNALPLDPYFLGVILGDGSTRGCIRKDGSRRGSLVITSNDKEIEDECNLQAAKYGLQIRKRRNTSLAISYAFAGVAGRENPICKILDNLGVRGCDASEKFIPEMYKTATIDERRQILAGLIDTDGHLSKKNFDFISKSKTLADDVAFICRSLGLSANPVPCQKFCQTGGGGTYYRVHISGDTDLIPCRIPRKKAPKKTDNLWGATRLKFDVVPTHKEEDYYGFSLDGDSRYLLDDFTVTHNSMQLAFEAAIAAMQGENVAFLSVELAKAIQHQRILAAIMAVPINDLMDRNVRKQAVDGFMHLKNLGKIGKIVIEHFSPNTITIQEAIRWYNQQEKLHGCRFRVRILDHADLVLSGSKDTRESKYNHGEVVWNLLAGMALSEDNPELQNWVFTATQSTRPQWKPGTPIPPLTRTQCSDSAHKFRASRLFITMTPQDDIKAEKGYLWNIDKNTYGFGVGEIIGPIPHQRHMARMADPSHLVI